MKRILSILKDINYTVHQTERFNLDNFYFDPYQDEGEEFERNKIFETANKGKFVSVNSIMSTSNFAYFLDGSRLTYKIGDIETVSGKYLPIVAGQIASGVCKRINGKIKKHSLERKNLLLLPNSINSEDINEIKKKITNEKLNQVSFQVETYIRKNNETRPENYAIASIHKIMQEMEIKLLEEIVNSRLLKPDSMLILDGSLQFMNKKADDRLFENVIGVSKTFNPNLSGILKRKNQQIGTLLTKLKYKERTPVYEYPLRDSKRIIGAWYLRIRPIKSMKNPLDGIIKIEKIAVKDIEKEDGFESGLIDNISNSILLERNVTTYGKEDRWPNHLYPIHLTERMLKESFLSSTNFLNRF